MTEGMKLDPDSDPWDKITVDLQFHAKKSNMSYKHIARLLGRSYSNVSNIMTGRRRIKEEDAERLDAHWELGQHFTWLLKQARRQANQDREWFKAYLNHEAAADTIKTYEALAIPGLFQLPEYAGALIRALGTHDVEEQVARRSLARLHARPSTEPACSLPTHRPCALPSSPTPHTATSGRILAGSSRCRTSMCDHNAATRNTCCVRLIACSFPTNENAHQARHLIGQTIPLPC